MTTSPAGKYLKQGTVALIIGAAYFTAALSPAFADEQQDSPSSFFDRDTANTGLLEGIDVGAPHRSGTSGASGSTKTRSYYQRRAKKKADSFNFDPSTSLGSGGSNQPSLIRRTDMSGITPATELATTDSIVPAESSGDFPPSSSAQGQRDVPADKSAVADKVIDDVTASADAAKQSSNTATPGSPEYVQGLLDQVSKQGVPADGPGNRPQPKNAVTDANRF